MTVKRQFQDRHALEQMQWYQATLGNQWDLVWKPDVNLDTELPIEWSEIWDTRLVRSTGEVYRYTTEWWVVVSWGGWSVTVDTEMSDSSTNAVQNKTIKKYVDDWLAEKKCPEVIDQDTYDELPSSKDTDWIIRFIYTEEEDSIEEDLTEEEGLWE